MEERITVKINDDNENLYCLYDKCKIEIGEKYVETEDNKIFCWDCWIQKNTYYDPFDL